jgi:hypothetical protein
MTTKNEEKTKKQVLNDDEIARGAFATAKKYLIETMLKSKDTDSLQECLEAFRTPKTGNEHDEFIKERNEFIKEYEKCTKYSDEYRAALNHSNSLGELLINMHLIYLQREEVRERKEKVKAMFEDMIKSALLGKTDLSEMFSEKVSERDELLKIMSFLKKK